MSRFTLQRISASVVVSAFLMLAMTSHATAQNDGKDTNGKKVVEKRPANPLLEIYGYVMTDIIHDFGQVNPDWFDVLRPTKLPSFEDEFGENDHQWFSVRQTRFGAKSYFMTDLGELFAQFEWELFGVGVDAGQTTFRLRHAYAELGKFGAGQYWSPFMDIDVFPNSIEYWGPNGMVFYRNVQFRYMPIRGACTGDCTNESRVTIAIERPGASGDAGRFEDRIELQNIRGRFPVPDVTAEGRYARSWGYVELAGAFRWIKWDDLITDDEFDLEGEELGWGVSLSGNYKPVRNVVLRWQGVVGSGVQNYMNDAPVDIGIVLQPGNLRRPIDGETLDLWAGTAFLDVQWSRLFSTALGYSILDIDNSDGQNFNAFHRGQYALINLLYYPTTNVMVGGEVQWGRRDNAFDDWNFDDVRLQFSARVNYSLKFWNGVTNDK